MKIRFISGIHGLEAWVEPMGFTLGLGSLGRAYTATRLECSTFLFLEPILLLTRV